MTKKFAGLGACVATSLLAFTASANDGWIDVEDRELRANPFLETGMEKFETTALRRLSNPDDFDYQLQKRNGGRTQDDYRFYFFYSTNTDGHVSYYYIILSDVLREQWRVKPAEPPR